MTLRRIAVAALTLATGYAVAAGLAWALVNVPESNVLALALSALLVVAVGIVVGATTAACAAVGDGVTVREAWRRAFGTLPAFAIGLLIFAAVWWLTGAADTWWRVHRGEIDALFIRYLGIARTGIVHAVALGTVAAIRWIVGLSTIASLVTTASVRGSRAVADGLRHAWRLVPLLALCAALVFLIEAAWPLAYWRPRRLAPSLEPAFVAGKLTILYLAASAAAAAALIVYRRSARRGVPI